MEEAKRREGREKEETVHLSGFEAQFPKKTASERREEPLSEADFQRLFSYVVTNCGQTCGQKHLKTGEAGEIRLKASKMLINMCKEK